MGVSPGNINHTKLEVESHFPEGLIRDVLHYSRTPCRPILFTDCWTGH